MGDSPPFPFQARPKKNGVARRRSITCDVDYFTTVVIVAVLFVVLLSVPPNVSLDLLV